MVQALKEIQAAKTIENVEDLSEYGLEDAVCSITVQGEKEYRLAIGEETGLGGQRYLSIGDGNVYLVDASLLDTFALGLYDIVEKRSIPSMTDLRGYRSPPTRARWRWNTRRTAAWHTVTSIPGSGRLTGVTRHWTRTWRNPWSRTSPV